MTICASVKVRDGLVLGTDSMTQIWGQIPGAGSGVIKTYSHARKLFQIKDWPIGVMGYGLGNIGPRSVQGLVLDFAISYNGPADVQSVAGGLFNVMNTAYQAHYAGATTQEPVGFFVAGYSPNQPFAEEWEFRLPQDTAPRQVRAQQAFGISWRGIEIPFLRLFRGYDPRAEQELLNLGVAQNVIDQALKKWSLPIVYDGMPVQDAVNFAVFILRTTIGVSAFEIGVPSCGGPLQAATILPTAGFRWVLEPSLSVHEP